LFLCTVFLLAIRLPVVKKLELRVELSCCNTEKVAAVVQHQNVQHGSVLIRVLLYDSYFGDRCSLCRRLTYLAATATAAAAIAYVAAPTFLGLQLLFSLYNCSYSKRLRHRMAFYVLMCR